MKNSFLAFLITGASALVTFDCYAQLPSFPGASGFGSSTAGGRGGSVIEVVNLNDDGPGSLREALNTPGPRTIVFRVGGIINLQSDLQLTEPNVTIAGQTAPGDGIVLKNQPLSIFTHDIIIRGMRFRTGDDADGAQGDLRDCVAMQTGTHNVIFDHCSFSWALDENISMQDSTTDVTIQWCIISEALFKNRHPKGPHSMGLLVFDRSHGVSIHHNLLAHNNGRNPVIMGAVDVDFLNNVIYDWGYSSEFLENGAELRVDIAGNYWKPRTSDSGTEHPLSIDFDSSSVFDSRLYCVNNLDPNGIFLTQQEIDNFGGNAVIFSPVSLMSEQTGIPFFSPAEAFDTVLAYAGAIHPLRDGTDTRVITDVRDSTGWLLDCIYAGDMPLDSGNVISATDTSIIYDQLNQDPAISPEGRRVDIISGTGAGQSRTGISVRVIDVVNRIVEGIVDVPWNVNPDNTSRYKVTAPCDSYLGAWPVYSTGTPYIDSDHDGMSNIWETAHGLNVADAGDANGTDINDQGYTNLEVYLNEYYTPNSNTGIYDHPGQPIQVLCYPNPFSNFTTIAFDNPLAEKHSFTLYDANGKVIRIMTGITGEKIRLEKQSLGNGLYFFRLQNNSGLDQYGNLVIE